MKKKEETISIREHERIVKRILDKLRSKLIDLHEHMPEGSKNSLGEDIGGIPYIDSVEFEEHILKLYKYGLLMEQRQRYEERVYTVKEISELLKIHWQTVLNYIKTGRLKAIRIGKGYRITKDSLDKFINDNKT
ncbi:MAG: helix-turn-helix domain-containing protein [Promethearchaeota archaeon]